MQGTTDRDARVFVVAEAGVNHNGDLGRARAMIDAAAAAGADAVKFQTFKADRIVTRDAGKADYQHAHTGDGGQLEMLRALELLPEAHAALRDHAEQQGIEFMSTPFDVESLRFLVRELGVRRLKLPSGELTHGALLWEAGRSGLPVILSTGQAYLNEVSEALAVLAHGIRNAEPPASLAACVAGLESAHADLARHVTLLHCTSQYPTPLSAVNLRAMDTLAESFSLPVGYSDHTEGISVALAAAARGACVIEKHFTLDRGLPGPDHAASLEPAELCAMVAGIRAVSEALGTQDKAPQTCEADVRAVARKSLLAARPLRAGTRLGPDDLIAKRPAGGLSPMRLWELCGGRLTRDYAADERLCEQDLVAENIHEAPTRRPQAGGER